MADKPRVSPETLVRMATYYLARHSASTERLRDVLARKVGRRCREAGEDLPDEAALRALVDPVVERLTRTGLLDDAAFARGRATSLAAKGRPAWRIRADLARAGVDAGEVPLDDLLDDLDPVAQARIWARRRRLGPFRPRDRDLHREKDVARLARAGFPASVAKAVVDGGEASGDDSTDLGTPSFRSAGAGGR